MLTKKEPKSNYIMNSKPSLNIKMKSAQPKNEKLKEKYLCSCIWFFLLNLKNSQTNKDTKLCAKETLQPEKTLESGQEATKSKCIRKSHIIRIPKIGCDVPFLVTMFTNLSNIGAVRMDERAIMNAVNVITKVKKDLDEGNPWNGNIEIAENLILKLYKSGLILYNKK